MTLWNRLNVWIRRAPRRPVPTGSAREDQARRTLQQLREQELSVGAHLRRGLAVGSAPRVAGGSATPTSGHRPPPATSGQRKVVAAAPECRSTDSSGALGTAFTCAMATMALATPESSPTPGDESADTGCE